MLKSRSPCWVCLDTVPMLHRQCWYCKILGASNCAISFQISTVNHSRSHIKSCKNRFKDKWQIFTCFFFFLPLSALRHFPTISQTQNAAPLTPPSQPCALSLIHEKNFARSVPPKWIIPCPSGMESNRNCFQGHNVKPAAAREKVKQPVSE